MKIKEILPYWGNCGSVKNDQQTQQKVADSLVGTEVSQKWEALNLLEKKFKEIGYHSAHIHEHYNNESAKIGWNIYISLLTKKREVAVMSSVKEL